MNRRGFTIIELIVVITIMGILMTLGVVNLRGSQVNARDAERKVDVETIALHLESYYTSGGGNDSSDARIIGYPSTAIFASGSTSMINMLRDIDVKTLTAPDENVPATLTPELTFIPATCSGACVQTTAGVTPQPTHDQYVYQPIKSDGTLCITTEECRKFNLYYRLEADSTIQMITSKKQ